ncbi:unnamed protein product [Rangifer tarandus platyrhynchus]|uniref:Uncharacterized protein n=2 Tax=Rangifer tarandus platyrhynchus TaxID=3082113 RepID=A0ACB0EDP2_RANTA|nr:unnamed protein product [Rangifer tarandus platyrhynchus]CAI9698316.1 unnamed protein product [Rangifer tarandus platyrhynchus]
MGSNLTEPPDGCWGVWGETCRVVTGASFAHGPGRDTDALGAALSSPALCPQSHGGPSLDGEDEGLARDPSTRGAQRTQRYH